MVIYTHTIWFCLFSTLKCTVICDWIMLTFIDKNEVYSERKFDEVSASML